MLDDQHKGESIYSLEAEQAVLGAIILDNALMDEISHRITSEDFYVHLHRHLYETMHSMITRGSAVDVVTIVDHLQSEEALSYVGLLARDTPTTANCLAYVQIIKEKSLRRKLLSFSQKAKEYALDDRTTNTQDAIGRLQESLNQISHDLVGSEGPEHIKAALLNVMENLETLIDNNGADVRNTGYPEIDEIIYSLEPGDLIILAARPSQGKTTLAMNIATRIAMQSSLPVQTFSLEMPAPQIATRLICSLGKLHFDKIRKGDLTEEDWVKFTTGVTTLRELPIYIDDSPSLSVTDIQARAKHTKNKLGDTSLVVVDYLQFISPSSQSMNKNDSVSEISRGLKTLAKDLQCPVIALSQLNRALEQRPDKRPIPSDLRESGSLEQDADLIMFIYRDEIYNPDTPDQGLAEIIIAKQRNGPLGTAKLAFVGEYCSFESLTQMSNLYS